MKNRLAGLLFVLPALAGSGHAHRLDEYLQATTISVENGRVDIAMRLSPGVAVAPFLIAAIDLNRDGVLSPSEGLAYAHRVLSDVSLQLDGLPLSLQLVSQRCPSTDDMREGLGEMRLELTAAMRVGGSASHALTFDNRHLKQISVFLVNALAPSSADFQIASQQRNFDQSWYRLEYRDRRSGPGAEVLTGERLWVAVPGILFAVRALWYWRRRSWEDARLVGTSAE